MVVDGELSPRIRELTILRAGWNCRAEYKFGQHAAWPARSESPTRKSPGQKEGPDAEGWAELEAAMLRAADELHADASITDGTWALLAAHFNERQLIEVPALVGQYHLVSYMLNSLGIEREPGLGGFDGYNGRAAVYDCRVSWTAGGQRCSGPPG